MRWFCECSRAHTIPSSTLILENINFRKWYLFQVCIQRKTIKSLSRMFKKRDTLILFPTNLWCDWIPLRRRKIVGSSSYLSIQFLLIFIPKWGISNKKNVQNNSLIKSVKWENCVAFWISKEYDKEIPRNNVYI